MQTCYRRAVKRSYRIVVAGVIVAASLTACQSTPEEIPPDLSQMEMFQRAQEAADDDNFDLALRYYQEFKQRFPDDPGALVEADYEIAFIAYKQERYQDARAGFEEILGRYEGDDARRLPEWPQVLSERLIERIDEIGEEEGISFDTGASGPSDDDSTSDR